MTNIQVHDHGKVVSRSTVVPASADKIFDVLADARRHREFDGSGSVRDAFVDAPERLSLGAKFGMKMRIVVPYSMTNTVVEFEEGRRIGWRHVGGHVWRYILEPVEGGTKVTEEFDWSTNRAPLMLKVMNAQKYNANAIDKTLGRLVAMFS
ncbi:MAG: SRPBCC family protein [Ilumatobacteraceae bacterium]